MKATESIGISEEFGYYPKNILIDNERFSIQTLPGLQDTVTEIMDDPNIHKDWIYPGVQRNIDFNGKTSFLPYNARIFGLPKTHLLTLHKSDNRDDLDFVVWCLSFFTGMRLTITELGFLDATPIKPGKLVDFTLVSCTLEDAIDLALNYLELERNNDRATKRVIAVINSLFLAQYPQNLPFEKFQYLYMGLDSCYKLIEEKSNPKPNRSLSHAARVQWMCERFNICIPDWAIIRKKIRNNSSKPSNVSEISEVRNDTIHEALFFDEPLGFAIYGGSQGNVILQMQHLICRLLVAILGKPENDYVKTRVDDRQIHGLNFSKN